MPTRQRLVTFGIPTAAVATIALAAGLSPWSGSDHPPPPSGRVQPGGPHQIDVVFAVDTTGSEGAKRTVWSIANHIRTTDANADLRIGLVAYRDVGDDYVTRDFALTTDLDAVFAELSSYQAGGGGDTPENVDAALDVTLHKMQWRAGAKKLVFLVGDAPPASRGDVPTFDVLAREAGAKQIVINTIRAGHDTETARTFQRIASLGRGEFSSIQQDGGVQQIATPYDDKLAELSATIDRGAIIVGDEGTRRAYAGKMAAAEAAAPAAKADRASYYAKGTGTRASDDLVSGYAAGSASVDAVATEALPAELRSMDKPALAAELSKRAEERKVAQKQIEELARKREAYLKEQEADAGAEGFDRKVKAAVEKQLK
jgi:hypothetical protein